MRLVVAATAVVAGFVMGAWGIARLAPDSPAWLKLTFAMVWLFALMFGVLLLGSKQRSEREDQRRLLGYGLLAAVLMALFLVPIFTYKLNVPKWAAEAILAAIAGAVFLLFKYMEHKKNQSSNG
jgi:peptidoglycan/LPS O-acetylase OafA/YrhL